MVLNGREPSQGHRFLLVDGVRFSIHGRHYSLAGGPATNLSCIVRFDVTVEFAQVRKTGDYLTLNGDSHLSSSNLRLFSYLAKLCHSDVELGP